MKHIMNKLNYYFVLLVLFLASSDAFSANMRRWGQNTVRETNNFGYEVILGALSVGSILFAVGSQWGPVVVKNAMFGAAILFGAGTILTLIKAIFV